MQVDPTQLPGELAYAEVQGLDADQEQRGPLFRVPVTVIRPARLDAATSQPSTSGSAQPLTQVWPCCKQSLALPHRGHELHWLQVWRL